MTAFACMSLRRGEQQPSCRLYCCRINTDDANMDGHSCAHVPTARRIHEGKSEDIAQTVDWGGGCVGPDGCRPKAGCLRSSVPRPDDRSISIGADTRFALSVVFKSTLQLYRCHCFASHKAPNQSTSHMYVVEACTPLAATAAGLRPPQKRLFPRSD